MGKASRDRFDVVGESEGVKRLFETARKLSAVRSSVLILGESGTGKELFARAIHYNGITRDKPFVAVNCGAIPESLIPQVNPALAPIRRPSRSKG